MLNFLSEGNQKQIIGIALTPGLGLEMAVIDKAKNVILNYGKRKVGYNFSTREIEDYLQFKTAVVELMEELHIPPKSYAYLILPNVYFDFTEVPLQTDDESIKTILLSKAEEFYLFKRAEPISGWCEVFNPDGPTQKRLAFTSLQKSSTDEIKEIIAEIGFQIGGIESNYSATLRGLYITGKIDDMIEAQAPWTAMLINTNSYTFFQMDGKNLIDYSETPLAIKSFSQEEAYQAIASGSSQLLNSMPFERLYIISQTDDICADVLKNQIEFDKEIVAIDTNKYSKAPLLEVSPLNDVDANSISLNAIAATNIRNDFNLTINVLADDPDASIGIYCTTKILGTDIDVTREVVIKASVALSILLGAVFGLIVLVFMTFNNISAKNIANMATKIQECDIKIQEKTTNAEKPEVDMSAIVDGIVDENVEAIKYYDSIATDIPKNVWLTKYYNKNGTTLAVKGIAESIEDIYEYYKNLRIVSPAQQVKLTELRVITPESTTEDNQYIGELAMEKNGGRLYSFEISNIDIEFDQYDIAHPKKEENQPTDEQGNVIGVQSENDIIIKPTSKRRIEQTSDQMQPTDE